jgi:plastocyanin
LFISAFQTFSFSVSFPGHPLFKAPFSRVSLTQVNAGLAGLGQSDRMKTKVVSTFILAAALVPLLFTGCDNSPDIASPPPQVVAPPVAFTGQVHEIKMRGTPKGYGFEPKELTIKSGDKVRFLLTDGGPHNVSFNSAVAPDATKIPAGAKMILENQGKLVGALLQAPGQAYELEFSKNLPVGEYNFVCDPHTVLGMKGKITVTP